ncbi:hypothetical protein C8R47DRAFT_603004 [Mycena vitilis]|nr:hypothetical protein C8R47DRAFT_603004 [Mycena vitilis]
MHRVLSLAISLFRFSRVFRRTLHSSQRSNRVNGQSHRLQPYPVRRLQRPQHHRVCVSTGYEPPDIGNPQRAARRHLQLCRPGCHPGCGYCQLHFTTASSRLTAETSAEQVQTKHGCPSGYNYPTDEESVPLSSYFSTKPGDKRFVGAPAVPPQIHPAFTKAPSGPWSSRGILLVLQHGSPDCDSVGKGYRIGGRSTSEVPH